MWWRVTTVRVHAHSVREGVEHGRSAVWLHVREWRSAVVGVAGRTLKTIGLWRCLLGATSGVRRMREGLNALRIQREVVEIGELDGCFNESMSSKAT